MAGVEEAHRQRIALVLLLIGTALLLAGVAMVLQHQNTLHTPQAKSVTSQAPEAKLRVAQILKESLFALLVLVIIFGTGTFAFLRWSRRFRQRLLRRPRPPTPSEDVWAMHRLPDELGPTGDMDPTEHEPDRGD